MSQRFAPRRRCSSLVVGDRGGQGPVRRLAAIVRRCAAHSDPGRLRIDRQGLRSTRRDRQSPRKKADRHGCRPPAVVCLREVDRGGCRLSLPFDRDRRRVVPRSRRRDTRKERAFRPGAGATRRAASFASKSCCAPGLGAKGSRAQSVRRRPPGRTVASRRRYSRTERHVDCRGSRRIPHRRSAYRGTRLRARGGR